MFRQAVYRKVVGPGASPTAGLHALAGIISPPDFDHRSQLQRLPMAQVGALAMSNPPRVPGLADIVWIARQSRPDPAFFRFNQRAPLAQVDLVAVGFAPMPNIQTRVAVDRSGRLDPGWVQLFGQRLPITPPLAISSLSFVPPPVYLDFYKPTWSPAYWFQHRTQVASDAIAPTGGGPRRVYRWTPIEHVVTVAHEFTADDWLMAAIAAGLTPGEAALLYALTQEA